MEEGSSVRHEYVAGQVYAMTGATRRHNRIVLSIATRLHAAARGSSCRVYVESVRLRAAADVIYYPDVMVACGPPGPDPLTEKAPCVVVEVLSPGTREIDRREKAFVYKGLPGLRAYLIVHQDVRRVERHWRDEEGSWWYADTALQGRVPIPCPELVMELDEFYEGVDREGPAAEERDG